MSSVWAMVRFASFESVIRHSMPSRAISKYAGWPTFIKAIGIVSSGSATCVEGSCMWELGHGSVLIKPNLFEWGEQETQRRYILSWVWESEEAGALVYQSTQVATQTPTPPAHQKRIWNILCRTRITNLEFILHLPSVQPLFSLPAKYVPWPLTISIQMTKRRWTQKRKPLLKVFYPFKYHLYTSTYFFQPPVDMSCHCTQPLIPYSRRQYEALNPTMSIGLHTELIKLPPLFCSVSQLSIIVFARILWQSGPPVLKELPFGVSGSKHPPMNVTVIPIPFGQSLSQLPWANYRPGKSHLCCPWRKDPLGGPCRKSRWLRWERSQRRKYSCRRARWRYSGNRRHKWDVRGLWRWESWWHIGRLRCRRLWRQVCLFCSRLETGLKSACKLPVFQRSGRVSSLGSGRWTWVFLGR